MSGSLTQTGDANSGMIKTALKEKKEKKNIATRLKAFGKCKQRLFGHLFFYLDKLPQREFPAGTSLVCVRTFVGNFACFALCVLQLDQVQNSANPKQESPDAPPRDISALSPCECVCDPERGRSRSWLLPPRREQCMEAQSFWQPSQCIMGTVNDSSSAFRRPDNKDIPVLGAGQADVPSRNSEKRTAEQRIVQVVSSRERARKG